jgi:MFS family permease
MVIENQTRMNSMSTSSPDQIAETRPTPGRIPKNVVILGWVSLLNDAASEMLYPIIPLFLTAFLGASPALLGLIDGAAEGIGSALRWLGGALSDRFRRRKPFVVAGYALSAISKPIMGLSAFILGWPMFMIGRCSDRLGKSVRNAARDALIAASTPQEMRGRAFGFQRAMDTCGAIIGPLVTLFVILLLVGAHVAFTASWKGGGEHTLTLQNLPLKWLFFIAFIPGCLTVACTFAIREIPPKPDEPTKTGGKTPRIFQSFPAPLWRIILAAFVFSLGNSSDTFLILRSSQIGLTFGLVILAYTLYNIVYAAASEPLGGLSDKIGRKPLLIAGWTIYAAVYAGFAIFRAPWAPWVLLTIYGLYQAMTDGVTSALISDIIPDYKRAGAIGLYYTATGLAQLTGSVLAGAVYNVFIFHGQIMLPFALGSMFALAAIPLLVTIPVKKIH